MKEITIETLNSANKDLGKDLTETKILIEKSTGEEIEISRQVTRK